MQVLRRLYPMRIVHDKRAVTADRALRLARHLGTAERFWLNLQARYDLEIEKDRLGDRLRREVRVLVSGGVRDSCGTIWTCVQE